jgi:hypothetical protein
MRMFNRIHALASRGIKETTEYAVVALEDVNKHLQEGWIIAGAPIVKRVTTTVHGWFKTTITETEYLVQPLKKITHASIKDQV